MKNRRKIKDRTFAIVIPIVLALNKTNELMIAHFENFVTQSINVSDNTGVWGRSLQRSEIFTVFLFFFFFQQ